MTPHRKDFLKLLAAGAAGAVLPSAALPAPQQTAAAGSKAEEFAARVLDDWGTACRGALCYIGDRLGIFKVMAAARPVTPAELARRTKLNERMLREWSLGPAA